MNIFTRYKISSIKNIKINITISNSNNNLIKIVSNKRYASISKLRKCGLVGKFISLIIIESTVLLN